MQNVECPSPQNVEIVGAPPRERVNEEEPVRRTYEDAFMEEVRNLGPVRQRRMPSRFQDYDCLFVDSKVDDPGTVHEALNGKHSDQWKEAMKSEYSSLIKNDTWELVPPPEGKNIVGSRWVLIIKGYEDGPIDRFKARLVAQGYSEVRGTDYYYLLTCLIVLVPFGTNRGHLITGMYTTSGYIFHFGNGTISWFSRKQPTVSKSSTEAKYVALSSATQEATWLSRLMKDLGKRGGCPDYHL